MHHIEAGQRVAVMTHDDVTMFEGVVEYLTPDGWVGIRQQDGRLDEAKAEWCELLA